MDMSMSSKNLTDFFCHKRGGEVQFADGEGIRCRLGLCVRTVWVSDNGFIPARPSRNEFVMSVSHKRLADFGVVYVASPTREINPEIPGRIVCADLIEDNGVFYYTILFERKERPRSLEKVNWE
jgi:hypothetical protein